MREHQLRAILFSDIVGYSRQMARDEAQTLTALKRNKDNHQRIVSQHNGRVIETIGDGHLCLFSSSLDAVYAGLALMRDLAERGDETQLRIGVHVGDTLVEKRGLSVRRVFGDCVNIAARIESNAPGPGVWVSARVASDVRNHAPLELTSAGVFNLKNIPDPMEIFSVTADGAPETRPDSLPGITYRRLALPRSLALGVVALLLLTGIGLAAWLWEAEDAETLAILPLQYVGANADYEYLAQATTTRLQSHLVGIPTVKLVSQNSARRLDGAPVPLGDEELDFFLEGTLILVDDQLTLEISIIEADDDTLQFNQQWLGSLDTIEAIEQQALDAVFQFVEESI